ncbi:hypothetical protein QLX67_09025 [Balneolaceae bacterium ANBcel3]|nr:hypothetical protein [Balneolaceae bacterium ANBcel3]
MGKKIIFYTLAATGVLLLLTGIQNFYLFWSEWTISGILGQMSGVLYLIGGFVNIWVARYVKKSSEEDGR